MADTLEKCADEIERLRRPRSVISVGEDNHMAENDTGNKNSPSSRFNYQLTMVEINIALDALAAAPMTPNKLAAGKEMFAQFTKHYQRLTFTPALMLNRQQFKDGGE